MGIGRRLIRKSARRAVRKTVRKVTPRPVRLVTPRPVRQAAHPVRAARNAVTPRPARQMSRAVYTARSPVSVAEDHLVWMGWSALFGRRKRRGAAQGKRASHSRARHPVPAMPPSAAEPGSQSKPLDLGDRETWQPAALRRPKHMSPAGRRLLARDLLVRAATLTARVGYCSASMLEGELDVSPSEAALLADLLEGHGIIWPDTDHRGVRAARVSPDQIARILASLQLPSGTARVAPVRPAQPVPADNPPRESPADLRETQASTPQPTASNGAGQLEYDIRLEVGLGAPAPDTRAGRPGQNSPST